MPGNITQFTSPIDKLQPSETGIEALARAGRIEKENADQTGRIYSGIINQVGDTVDRYQTMNEISQGSAALAVMHNNLTTQWNKIATSTDPNDTSIQQTFMEQANQSLDNWSNSFDTKRGQEWALSQADNMRSHFYDKTSADMGIRAG